MTELANVDGDVLVDFNDLDRARLVVRVADVRGGAPVAGQRLQASDGEGLHSKVLVTRVEESGLVHLEVVDTPS